MSDLNSFISSLSDEQKNALLDILTKQNKQVNNTKSTNKIPDSTNSARVESDFTMKKAENSNNRRKEPVRARKNEWVDSGEDRDIETPKFERTPRNRSPHKKVDVECSICGRSFKADPKYIYGEYQRCSRCTGR